jgi:anaerobic magnesium-protoporphyrin IX monomethyl ester cyclase
VLDSPPLNADTDGLWSRACDTSRPIMLVGSIHQEILGLGYLASVLDRYGYRVRIFDFEREPGEILATARTGDPLIIGFSLIFQFYISQFSALIRYLRANGFVVRNQDIMLQALR